MTRKITVIVYRYLRTFISNQKRPDLTQTQMSPREVEFEIDESLFTKLTKIVPFNRWVDLWTVVEERWPAQAGNPQRMVPTKKPYYSRERRDVAADIPWVSYNGHDEERVKGYVQNLQNELQQSNWPCTLYIIDSDFITDPQVRDKPPRVKRPRTSDLLLRLKNIV